MSVENPIPGDKQRSVVQIAELLLLGAVAGFLSGMFGVGGGIIIVPAMVAILNFSPRLASGTSLATIVPLAAVGVISYAAHGSVSWMGALLLVAGSVVGAQVGTWLLTKIKRKPLQIFFALFIVVAIVSMFLVVPSRDSDLVITWVTGPALVALGLVTGTLSGLLGVGGGVVVVPALMLFFGVSDLIAKGTSLLVMIPTAVAGTVSNVKRKNVDLPAAVMVGLPACATTYLGALAAEAAPEKTANIYFAIFLAFVAAQLLWTAFHTPRNNPSSKDRA